MDIASVIGLVLVNIVIFGSIIIGGSTIGTFYDLPSVIIVFGGAVAAVLISFPMNKVKTLFKVILKGIKYPLPDPVAQIEQMAEFAALARREGLLALEEKLASVNDAFLVKGLRLVVDGFPPEVVRGILECDLSAMQERHGNGKAVLDKFGEVSPAYGMIGTLIGLVIMLKNLSDPSQIGGGMAVALLTTFYGAYLANCLFLPLSTKLDQRKKEETFVREIMIEGIAAIQSGDKPAMVKEKLKAYLPPGVRATLEEKAKK